MSRHVCRTVPLVPPRVRPTAWALQVLTVALALVTCLGAARPALAQGTSDLFPDPMSSADMEAVLTRIGLDGETKVAALKAFESYVDRFLQLRKGDIDEYLKGRSSPGQRPSREEVAARVHERQALLKRIAAIENQLFDDLRGTVSDGQLAEVERERARADRRRNWSASHQFLGRGTRIELADLLESSVGEATVSAETTAAVTAAVRSYEEQYTALVRKLLELAIEEPVLMADARASLPQPPEPAEGTAPPDPGVWREHFRALEAARARVREPQAEVRERIRSLNRSTARQITTLLPEPMASKFHQSVLERAYPGVAKARDPVPPIVDDARELAAKGEITADELKRVEELATQHRDARRQLDEQIMAALDKQPDRGPFSFAFFEEEGDTEAQETPASKLLAQRSRLDDSTREAIAGTTPKLADAKPSEESRQGDAQVIVNGMALDLESLDVHVGEGATEVIVVGDAAGMGDGATFVAMTSTDAPFSAMGAATPLTREDIDAIRERFALNDDEASVLSLMFDDYMSSWREIEEGDFAELKALPGDFAMGGSLEVPTAAELSRRFDLRHSITEQVIALDREFFESAGAALSGRISKKDAQRLQREREREAYIRADTRRVGMMGMGAFGASSAPTVDLAAVLRDAKLSEETLAAIDGRFDAWDASATDAFRARFETRFGAARENAELERRMTTKSLDDDGRGQVRIAIDSADADFAKIEAINKRAAAADDITRHLNETAIEDMANAIPDAAARRALLDAWDRKAWPSVFRDRRDIAPFIAKAEGLADLSPETRAALAAAVQEHWTEYRRISDEMIETNRKMQPPSQAPGQAVEIDFRAVQARQDTLNRLRFERDELNERSLRRIKELLTPEQAEQVGSLPSRSTQQPRSRQFRSAE